MPKETWVINRFEGGQNNAADPRDIEDNQGAVVENVRIEQVGRIAPIGQLGAVSATLNSSGLGEDAVDDITIPAGSEGYGLFGIRHDRTGGNNPPDDMSGIHDGSVNQTTTLTDSGHKWRVDSLIGAKITLTSGRLPSDSSVMSTKITDNTLTTVVTATLAESVDWDPTSIHTVDDLSPVTHDNADGSGGVALWQASQEHDAFAMTSSSASGAGATASCITDGSGNPSFIIVDGGTGWAEDETVVFQDPGSTDNYATLTVDLLGDRYELNAFPETGADYIIYSDMTLLDHWIYSNQANGDGWTEEPVVNLGDAGTDGASADATNRMLPCYYYQGGAVRICDGNFNNDATTNQWWGYIERKRFKPLDSTETSKEFTIDSWYNKAQEIKSPGDLNGVWATATDVSGTVSCTNATYTGNQAKLTGWHIFFELDGVGGGGGSGWGGKKWDVAASYVYDAAQESPLTFISTVDHSSVATDEMARIVLQIDHTPPETGYKGIDPRITGVNIYMREEGTSLYYLQADVNLYSGMFNEYMAERRAWRTGDNVIYCNTSKTAASSGTPVMASPSQSITFQEHSGFSQDIVSLSARYKTATIAGGRTWIGNIEYTDFDGNSKVQSDGMIMSPTGAYDSFPADPMLNLVVLTSGDGDPIIKLEEFADRILQFRQRSLYILNISQSMPFVEESYEYKGVDNPAAVCRSDYGVAWVNEFGVYFYNGESIENLFEKDGEQIIKMKSTSASDSWEELYHSTAQIAYLPDLRQLLIVCRSAQGAIGQGFIYDMTTKGWIKVVDFKASAHYISNFVLNPYNNKVMWARYSGSTTNFYEWDHSNRGGMAWVYRSKDIDFEKPGVKKKIYNIKVSYKGDASGVTVGYLVDGDIDATNDAKPFINPATGSSDTTPLLDKSSAENLESWHVAELKPASSSDANGIYSIAIDMRQASAVGNFELNDITIIYRSKSVK